MTQSYTIWFTGRHGAGKSTIAEGLMKILHKKNIPAVLIDGDEARKTISSDLGYSIEERNEHMRRVANVCGIISKSNVLAIASVSSPTEKSRQNARKILKKMLLVHIDCPEEICRERDVKGHYKKAKLKKKGFENFLGISFDYKNPKNPDVVLRTYKETKEESLKKLIDALKTKAILKLK